MFGATLLYKTGKLHLMAAHRPEDSVFCLEAGSHAILDSKTFGSAEEFACSVRPDNASMSELRGMVYQEGNVHLSQKLSNDQILLMTARLLAQGRLKAVVCGNGAHGPSRSPTPSLYAAPFHLQPGLAPESECPYGLDHRVHQWTDLHVVESFVQRLFVRQDLVPHLRRLASTKGEEVSESDETLRKHLENLLMTGRLIAIECPLGGRPYSKDDVEEKATARKAPARTEETRSTKSDQRKLKTWIEIQLIDDEGVPVANQKYRLALPDNSVVEGTLDEHGWARHDEIDFGSCQVCFPEIDGRAWHSA